MSEIEDILKSKCIFCGYNGAGYYQEHTHDKLCPWHSIGGLEVRKMVFSATIYSMYKQLEQLKRDKEKLRQELNKTKAKLRNVFRKG